MNTLPKPIINCILEYLADHYPVVNLICKSFTILCKGNVLIMLQEYVKKENLHMIEWLLKIYEIGSTICNFAALDGNIKILKLVHKIKPIQKNYFVWTKSVFTNAVKSGYIETIQWLYDNQCPYGNNTLEVAAQYGHLHVFEWMDSQKISITYTDKLVDCAANSHAFSSQSHPFCLKY